MKSILISIMLFTFSVNLYSQSDNYTPISKLAWKMKQSGLVNLAELDSSFVIDLIYARKDNFVGEPMYATLREAYLQPLAAKKLVEAHKFLKEKHPNYSFYIRDGARPQSVQKIMWNKVKDTPMKNYVASPGRISMHTYGVAVDLTIVDENGKELDMGTILDYLGKEAEPKREAEFKAKGVLTSEHIKNRMVLRDAMKKAGFRTISNEWWHFEACTRSEAQSLFKPLLF